MAKAPDESLFTTLYYNYNWTTSPRTTFFVGPLAQFSIIEVAENNTISNAYEFGWGAHAGMRQYLTPSTAIVIEPRLLRLEFGKAQGGTTTTTQLLFGIAVTL